MLKLHPKATTGASLVSDDSMNGAGSMVIRAEGLTKRYGKTDVVDNLSFAIPRGSVFGLIGPNGAGKSTTLKMLMGLLGITSGSANILDPDVQTKFQSVKHRIGYVPETHHIYRWVKIKCVIRFTRSFYSTWNENVCRAISLES